MIQGGDGVKRESTFSERIYRRNDAVWNERVILSDSDHNHDHKAGEGHRHLDTSTSPMWIRRLADGNMDVRLVDQHERRTVKIDPQYYGNIGFSGTWGSVFYLSDPANLKTMRAVGAVKNGVQRYETKRGDMAVKVDWNVKGQYPQKVESLDAHGTNRRETTVTRIAAPKALPWQALGSYKEMDYSDLLD
ncbi:MAG: hypothetical protein NWQ13_00385 [Glaciimonas sp.]|nr:hypothetical protein [Glaciimonas sp.]